ncbi:MAG: hypothetical protein HN929_04835 [Chloroflexi bacterium]|jgi:hypothetical protein|nr:hypothetical protein [Chloroflexota bacterium]MBT7080778.1 hypothetical protein [Chloroflexota bacterium]MBT7289726.1 hypothetical protein [Chloroflexota bacterium]
MNSTDKLKWTARAYYIAAILSLAGICLFLAFYDIRPNMRFNEGPLIFLAIFGTIMLIGGFISWFSPSNGGILTLTITPLVLLFFMGALCGWSPHGSFIFVLPPFVPMFVSGILHIRLNNRLNHKNEALHETL